MRDANVAFWPTSPIDSPEISSAKRSIFFRRGGLHMAPAPGCRRGRGCRHRSPRPPHHARLSRTAPIRQRRTGHRAHACAPAAASTSLRWFSWSWPRSPALAKTLRLCGASLELTGRDARSPEANASGLLAVGLCRSGGQAAQMVQVNCGATAQPRSHSRIAAAPANSTTTSTGSARAIVQARRPASLRSASRSAVRRWRSASRSAVRC